MKKLLFVAIAILAFTMTAMAQGAAAGPSNSNSTTKTTTTKSTKTHQLTGCLAKDPSGGYLLQNGKYKSGVAVKSSQDISEHIGHKVQLTGDWEGTGKERTFNATSLKHISATCTVPSGKKSSTDTGASGK